jgi:hypothetical protein
MFVAHLCLWQFVFECLQYFTGPEAPIPVSVHGIKCGAQALQPLLTVVHLLTRDGNQEGVCVRH